MNGRLHALDLVENQADAAGGDDRIATAAGGVLEQQLDRREWIAELMGDAGGQSADGGEPLGAEDLLARGLQFLARSAQTIDDHFDLLLNRG